MIVPAWYFRDWNNNKAVLRLSLCSGNFYGSEIRHVWDFSGVKFWSRDFGGVCLKPLGFFLVLIFVPVRSSLSLEIRGIPPGTPSWLVSSIGRVLHRPWSQRSRVWILYELEFSFKTSVLCSCKSCVIVSKLTIGTVGIFLWFVCSNLGDYLPPVLSAGGHGGLNLPYMDFNCDMHHLQSWDPFVSTTDWNLWAGYETFFAALDIWNRCSLWIKCFWE